MAEIDRNTVEDLKVKVALGCRILAKLGLADYLGHVSARIPGTDRVLIKARGVDLGNLLTMTPDKVVMVDMEGNLIEGNYRPPAEVKLHTETFKGNSSIMALVHDHQHIATAFGAAGVPILPVLGVMAPVAAKPFPTYNSSLKVVDSKQGADVSAVLGDSVGVHLKNHGVLVTGKSIEEAVINTIWLEMQAKVTLFETLLGKPRAQSPEEVKLNTEQASGIAGRWKYYCSLLEEPYVTI